MRRNRFIYKKTYRYVDNWRIKWDIPYLQKKW